MVIQRHFDPESALEEQVGGLQAAIQHEIEAGREPSEELLEAQLEATERLRTRGEKLFEHIEALHRLAQLGARRVATPGPTPERPPMTPPEVRWRVALLTPDSPSWITASWQMNKPTRNCPAFIVTFPVHYFAAVMATGVLADACFAWKFDLAAFGLFALDIFLYAAFVVLLLLRLRFAWRSVRNELLHVGTGVAFLTLVAATNVVGSCFLVLGQQVAVARALWAVGGVLWAGLLYGFFSVAILGTDKPSLQDTLNGSWLLVVVSTQSIAVLGSAGAGRLLTSPWQGVVVLTLFLLGLFLYVPLITLILYRWMFLPLKPESLSPPYWINMGALAITALAGANLLDCNERIALLGPLRAALFGATFLAWGIATWWIPLLAFIGLWKHGVEGVPIRYDPLYWALVFPLGMYSLATFRVAHVTHLNFLKPWSAAFLAFGLVAWGLTMLGFVRRVGLVRRDRVQGL